MPRTPACRWLVAPTRRAKAGVEGASAPGAEERPQRQSSAPPEEAPLNVAYSQPFSIAMRTASVRFLAPVFWIAAER